MTQKELRDAFYLDRMNHDELMSLLLSYFSHSSHEPLSRLYSYNKQGDSSLKIDVDVDKTGRIITINPAAGLPEITLKEISDKIKDTLID